MTKIEKKFASVTVDSIRKVDLKKSNFERPPTNKFINISMDCKEIKEILGGRISGKKVLEKRTIDYPLYYYSYINATNGMSSATRSNRIGKLHSLFKQRKCRSLGEWKRYYNSKHPGAVEKAIDTLSITIGKGMGINARRKYKKYIRLFVENLVFNQTYTGLKIQEVILTKISNVTKKSYRWSTSKEDSAGIDGFIGGIPVTIKPETSKQKKKPGVKRIDYRINADGDTLSFTFSF